MVSDITFNPSSVSEIEVFMRVIKYLSKFQPLEYEYQFPNIIFKETILSSFSIQILTVGLLLGFISGHLNAVHESVFLWFGY